MSKKLLELDDRLRQMRRLLRHAEDTSRSQGKTWYDVIISSSSASLSPQDSHLTWRDCCDVEWEIFASRADGRRHTIDRWSCSDVWPDWTAHSSRHAPSSHCAADPAFCKWAIDGPAMGIRFRFCDKFVKQM